MGHRPKVYLTRKRRHDEEIERELMQQKAEFQTKIIDVNDDCLEKIFMYLDIDDFINIAHTSKQLKPAADRAFARKFGKKEVFLLIRYKYRGRSKLKIDEAEIEVYDFQTSLRLLRCFGHLVSQLKFGPKTTSRLQWTVAKIVGYANKFCSESLVLIIFFNMAAGAFEEVKKPFSAARNVAFYSCTLDGKLKQLSKWFPTMCNLLLDYVNTQLDHIEANSPYMLSLSVTGRKRNYSAERIMNALRLNPRLLMLNLNVSGWIRILQNASKNLLKLHCLDISWYPRDFWGAADHIFDIRTLVELQMDFHGFRLRPIPKIPISFERLQEFTWGLCGNPLEDSVIEFFKKHSFITKLILQHSSESAQQNLEDIMHIASALPLLREVNFERIALLVDHVISFIDYAKCLKRMCFYMTDRFGFGRLKTLLDKKWQASIDGQRVELKRED